MLRTKTTGNRDTIAETRTKLNTAGTAVPFGHVADMWNAYLGEQGYTGALNDRFQAFLEVKTLASGAVDDLENLWDGSL